MAKRKEPFTFIILSFLIINVSKTKTNARFNCIWALSDLMLHSNTRICNYGSQIHKNKPLFMFGWIHFYFTVHYFSLVLLLLFIKCVLDCQIWKPNLLFRPRLNNNISEEFYSCPYSIIKFILSKYLNGNNWRNAISPAWEAHATAMQ